MEWRPLAEKNAVTHALTHALKACEDTGERRFFCTAEDITLLKAASTEGIVDACNSMRTMLSAQCYAQCRTKGIVDACDSNAKRCSLHNALLLMTLSSLVQ